MTFVFIFKSCNKVFSDSIEISDCFPQQHIIKRKKTHTRQSLIDWLIDWLRDWCLTPTLVIFQLGDIWTPQIANKCIITSYQDICNFPLTGVLWKEPILLLYISSDRPSFVDILRRKYIHVPNAKLLKDHWGSDWCLTPTQQFVSYIMVRTS
jgi:hypothetical protein